MILHLRKNNSPFIRKLNNIAFNNIQMHSGGWGLSRETIRLARFTTYEVNPVCLNDDPERYNWSRTNLYSAG